ncbi:MAG: hypothetical protein AAFS04_14695 [Cyanobacteria bacterium J06631_9]
MAGMAVIGVCHVVYVVIVFFLPIFLEWLNFQSSDPYFALTVWFTGLLSIGLAQLLYVVPFYIFFRKKRKLEIAQGVAVMAVITLLLSGGCFLVLFSPV